MIPFFVFAIAVLLAKWDSSYFAVFIAIFMLITFKRRFRL